MNKIAFVSTNKSAWGGSEYLWYQTALRFSSHGKKIIVSIPRWKEIPDLISQFKIKGIELKYNTDSSSYKKLFNRFLPSSVQLNYKEDGYKFLLDFKPDLVVINQGGNTGGIDLMEYCIKHKFNFVTISNAANEAKWPTDILNERLSNAFPKAVMNYFVCRANIHLTEIQSGQKLTNAKVIFSPLSVSYDNDLHYPEVKENFSLAHAARHEFFAKGQDILLEVLNEKKWRERNIEVNFYGKGEHTNSLKKLKMFFDLEKINFPGHISSDDIWKQNHALILTSRYEGLPIVLVEAMLCGRFAIATNVSGNPEMIIDNENGFLAKAAKPEFVDEAMERAWKRKNEWEDLGKRAKEFARSRIPVDPVEFFYKELESLRI